MCVVLSQPRSQEFEVWLVLLLTCATTPFTKALAREMPSAMQAKLSMMWHSKWFHGMEISPCLEESEFLTIYELHVYPFYNCFRNYIV